MTEHIAAFFGSLPRELVTVLIGMIPIAELRGAIPWALAAPPIGGGLTWPTACTFAIIGNFIPVIPLLLFFEKVYTFLSRWTLFEKFFQWLFARTRKKGKMIERYEMWGLIIFVGIPLPVTGAWTGTLAAFLFGVKWQKAAFAIIGGLFMSATIVTLLTLGILNIF